MQRRERILAIVAAVIVVGAVGYKVAQSAIVGRFHDLNTQKKALGDLVSRLDSEKSEIEDAKLQIQKWTARSFPPDPVAAQRMYLAW